MTLRLPSPCGVLVLKLLDVPFEPQHGFRFRPLAGFWFLNSVAVVNFRPSTPNFRPLAGFWFLNYASPYRWRRCPPLPSPCGVLVLKFSRLHTQRLTLCHSFRPLAGFWFLNLYAQAMDALGMVQLPSPCGVLVLKCLADDTVRLSFSEASVPLRGSGS